MTKRMFRIGNRLSQKFGLTPLVTVQIRKSM